MGFIREPDGVDFVIDGRHLTEKDHQEISEFIQRYKREHDQSESLKNALRVLKEYDERMAKQDFAGHVQDAGFSTESKK